MRAKKLFALSALIFFTSSITASVSFYGKLNFRQRMKLIQPMAKLTARRFLKREIRSLVSKVILVNFTQEPMILP